MKRTYSFEETVIDAKVLLNLNPSARIDVIRGLVKKCVKEHPEGVTASLVAQELEMAQNTIKKHMDYLVATREIYSKIYSARNIIYFPNDRLSHPHAQSQLAIRGQLFRFSVIENQRGQFMYIQELQETPTMGLKIVGGIIIKLDNIDSIMDEMIKLRSRELEKNEKYPITR